MRAKKSLLQIASKNKSALLWANSLIATVSAVGFQWPNLKGPLAKVDEELAELKRELKRSPRDFKKLESELGDLLFTICNLGFLLNISTEKSLRKMLKRFERRFAYVEKAVHKSKKPWRAHSLAALDVFWNEAKLLERKKTKVPAKRKARRT